MSNHLTVAQVTEALCRFLGRASLRGSGLRGADRARQAAGRRRRPSATVNVFLYQVTPNAAVRNRDLPTRATDGTLIKRPQAAIDLHYLISFYGVERQHQPQQLLGSVVRALHETSRCCPGRTSRTPRTVRFLAGADLATSPQAVRFTPTQLDVDDMSKLWSMLFQTPFALSVMLSGGARAARRSGRASRRQAGLTRRVRAVPSRRPLIERLLSRPAGSTEAPTEGPVPGDHEILLTGSGLVGPDTAVRLGDVDVVPAQIADDRVVLMPPADLPPGIYPGADPALGRRRRRSGRRGAARGGGVQRGGGGPPAAGSPTRRPAPAVCSYGWISTCATTNGWC